MSRSTGVTIIAVLLGLGSLFLFACGILVGVFAPAAVRRGAFPMPPSFMKAVLLLVFLAYVLRAIWALVSAIGLFRLKNWARISTITFAAVMMAIGVFSLLIALVVVFGIVNEPAAAKASFAGTSAFVSLEEIGVSIWWIVFFTRPKVKAQFGSLP